MSRIEGTDLRSQSVADRQAATNGPIERPPKNLKPARLPCAQGSDGDYVQGLQAQFEFVTGQAMEAIDWYYHSKNINKRLGKAARLVALVSGIIAGIIPALAQITQDGRPLVPPALASVALALAAGMVALDRFYGFTAAWMRSVSIAQDLKKSLDEFQFDWGIEKAHWTGGHPTQEQAIQAMTRLREFIALIDSMVQKETTTWVTEFRYSLQTLEESAKTNTRR